MSRRWVVDASPLILLGKVGGTELLTRLADEILIPEAVAREVASRRDGEHTMTVLASLDAVQIVPTIGVVVEIEAWDLGPGESQGTGPCPWDPKEPGCPG